jgi:inner membrane protein
MQVPTHLALSWLIGHRLPERRDRVLVAWAGVLPDLDALTILKGSDYYSLYHHVVTHGIVGALGITLLATVAARQRWKVFVLALVATHFHMVCDLLGSGVDWPIVYWFPFSHHEYFTPYGWPLASWQNLVVGLSAMGAIAWIGIKGGHTFAEAFLPSRVDAQIVEVLRRRLARGHDSSARP